MKMELQIVRLFSKAHRMRGSRQNEEYGKHLSGIRNNFFIEIVDKFLKRLLRETAEFPTLKILKHNCISRVLHLMNLGSLFHLNLLSSSFIYFIFLQTVLENAN